MSWHNYFMNDAGARARRIAKHFAISCTWEKEELFYILTPCISATPVNASYAKGVIIQVSFLKFSVAFGFVFTPKTIKKENEK